MQEPRWYNRLVTDKTSQEDQARGAVKFTYEDLEYFRNAPNRERHELIDGEHYVTPSPNKRHQALLGTLHWLIRSFLAGHPVGEVFFAPLDVVFTDFDVVQPDLLFVSSRRSEVLTDANVQGPPDLVVEVLSESNRRYDEIKKRQLYDREGVGEYWILDPELETVKVYRRVDNLFRRVAELSNEAEDVLTSPLLPGLAIPLRTLFAE